MAAMVRRTQDDAIRGEGTTELIPNKGCKEDVTEFGKPQKSPSYAHGTPLWDLQLTWYQLVVLWILRQGDIPRHVTIVPDGNRRFARKTGIELSTAYGIFFEKLMLAWHCMAVLGVTEFTAFLFSTRNFVRDASEVGAVLGEVVRFALRTLHSLQLLRRLGLRVRVVGDMDLLPKELEGKTAQLEVATSGICGARTCSLCLAYNSKVDMMHMAQALTKAVKLGALESEDITQELIEDHLATWAPPEADIWYRSSGEQRFSEFMTLQSGYAYMYFGTKLWPSVGFWDWIPVMVKFQLQWPAIRAVKEKHRILQESRNCYLESYSAILRQRAFLRHLKVRRMNYIQGHCPASEE